jgi:hypothetical protein
MRIDGAYALDGNGRVSEHLVRFLARGFLLSAIVLSTGCNKAGETPQEIQPENIIVDEPPDPAQSGTYLRIGLFKEDAKGTLTRVSALNQAEVQGILRRYADRTRAGDILRGKPPRDGNGTTLGFIEGIPIVLREEGEVHIRDGIFPDRLDGFLKDLCSELGCAACIQAEGGRTSSLIRFVP